MSLATVIRLHGAEIATGTRTNGAGATHTFEVFTTGAVLVTRALVDANAEHHLAHCPLALGVGEIPEGTRGRRRRRRRGKTRGRRASATVIVRPALIVSRPLHDGTGEIDALGVDIGTGRWTEGIARVRHLDAGVVPTFPMGSGTVVGGIAEIIATAGNRSALEIGAGEVTTVIVRPALGERTTTGGAATGEKRGEGSTRKDDDFVLAQSRAPVAISRVPIITLLSSYNEPITTDL